MKLVIGLGNFGKEYINTRHNIGFDFIDSYLKHKKIDVFWKEKFDGKYIETNINNEKVIFLKPQTYMNLSGNSVKKIVDYFNIKFEDLLVVSDDLDLIIGNYKLKLGGSSGGHNGLKDIELKIGTNKFKRLKIGISNNKDIDTRNYVLGKLSLQEREKVNSLFEELYSVLDDYFILSFEELMNKYNRKNR